MTSVAVRSVTEIISQSYTQPVPSGLRADIDPASDGQPATLTGIPTAVGLRWVSFHQSLVVSPDGLMVTKVQDVPAEHCFGAVASDTVFTSGVHTWEVRMETRAPSTNARIFIGVARPGVDLCRSTLMDRDGQACWGMWSGRRGWSFYVGSQQCGEGMTGPSPSGVEESDTVTVVLDSDVGVLSFYQNGVFLHHAFCGLAGLPLSPCVFIDDVGTTLAISAPPLFDIDHRSHPVPGLLGELSKPKVASSIAAFVKDVATSATNSAAPGVSPPLKLTSGEPFIVAYSLSTGTGTGTGTVTVTGAVMTLHRRGELSDAYSPISTRDLVYRSEGENSKGYCLFDGSDAIALAGEYVVMVTMEGVQSLSQTIIVEPFAIHTLSPTKAAGVGPALDVDVIGATDRYFDDGDDLKIASWNVLIGSESWSVRIPALLAELRDLDADIVCLQEVGTAFRQALLSCPWVTERFWCPDVRLFTKCDEPRADCGGLYILSRFKYSTARFVKLTTCQRRGLFTMTLPSRDGTTTLGVGTVWLDSYPADGVHRAAQLRESFDVLRQCDFAILTGDYNFGDDGICEPKEGELPLRCVESDKAIRENVDFTDAWAQSHPDRLGFTWDVLKNSMAMFGTFSGNHATSARMDRLLYRSGPRASKHGRKRLLDVTANDDQGIFIIGTSPVKPRWALSISDSDSNEASGFTPPEDLGRTSLPSLRDGTVQWTDEPLPVGGCSLPGTIFPSDHFGIFVTLRWKDAVVDKS